MSGMPWKLKAFLTLLLASAAWTWAADPQFSIGSIIRGFELPQSDSQGNLRVLIKGQEATVLSANQIRINGLAVELYENGQSETRITSPESVFWRVENKLTTDKAIEVKRNNLTITARSIDWDLKEGRGTFRDGVQVVVNAGTF
jgi:hypothetical protein